MELTLNTPIKVNQNQYNFVRKFCKGLLAHRQDKDGNFYIKALCFMGQKQVIEEALNKLN